MFPRVLNKLCVHRQSHAQRKDRLCSLGALGEEVPHEFNVKQSHVFHPHHINTLEKVEQKRWITFKILGRVGLFVSEIRSAFGRDIYRPLRPGHLETRVVLISL